MSSSATRHDPERYDRMMKQALVEAEVERLEHVVDWLEEHEEAEGLLEIAAYELLQISLDNLVCLVVVPRGYTCHPLPSRLSSSSCFCRSS